MVARFLALLELFRDKSVAFEQVSPFGELTVRWTGSDAGEIDVVEEFEGTPPDPELPRQRTGEHDADDEDDTDDGTDDDADEDEDGEDDLDDADDDRAEMKSADDEAQREDAEPREGTDD